MATRYWDTVGTVNGWLLAGESVGQSIALSNPTATSLLVTYKNKDGNTVMSITIEYTDATKATILTATRSA